MHKDLLQWTVKHPLKHDGVIVGCSGNHEWMLPWWWMNYCIHNEYPVTFFDFGDMSPAAKQWCQRKGSLVTLQIPTESFVVSKEKVPKEQSSIWEKHQNLDTWLARLSWFKKPFACLQSPYERTIWIDLDCQVRESVTPIFECCDNSNGIAMAEEPPEVLDSHRKSNLILQEEMEYNSGVIAFKHGIPIIVDWAKMCIENNQTLRGDQEAFSRMIHEKDITIWPMHPSFNWRVHLPLNSPPVILHYLGVCKEFIKRQIAVFTETAFMDFSFEEKEE